MERSNTGILSEFSYREEVENRKRNEFNGAMKRNCWRRLSRMRERRNVLFFFISRKTTKAAASMTSPTPPPPPPPLCFVSSVHRPRQLHSFGFIGDYFRPPAGKVNTAASPQNLLANTQDNSVKLTKKKLGKTSVEHALGTRKHLFPITKLGKAI